MTHWRLIDSAILDAARNIALNQVIMDYHSLPGNEDKVTLRFLQFSPPCVLVGYNQVVQDEIRVEYCKTHSVQINRRLTGGGAIYLDKAQIGWEIYASIKNKLFPAKIDELYKILCNTAANGISKLGTDAIYRPRNDIVINGKKISGTGGTQQNESWIFQGTLLIDLDVDQMARALKIPIRKLSKHELLSIKERVTTLKNELGFNPSITDVKLNIIQAFSQTFNVEIKPEELSDYETNLLNSVLPYYSSDKWIYSIEPNGNRKTMLSAIRRFDGGTIQVMLSYHNNFVQVGDIHITGDVLVHPSRLLLDLEAYLKDIPLNELKKTINKFFTNTDYQVLGLQPEDIYKVISMAVNKLNFIKAGLSAEHANQIHLMNTELDFEKFKQFDTLLLPYCSKKIDCDYRKRTDCAFCEKCDISDGYNLGSLYNLYTISILSFEHLVETWEELKKKNSPGYIGICCKPFIIKHYDDFLASEIPALLIDNASITCYQLEADVDAHFGRFEVQTSFPSELITTLLSIVKA